MNFGFLEIFILFLIILILFGSKRIPDLFKAVGSSLRSFKKGIEDEAPENGAAKEEEKK